MDQIQKFLFGDNVANYVEVGFSQSEAKAMSFIASQKAKGKFYGCVTGTFLAFSWGHWHHRLLANIPFRFSKIYTQIAMIAIGITVGDYLYCVPRHGANEYFANNLLLNNNLFTANLNSLTANFEILNRKFTPEEVATFNQRAKAMRSNIPLAQRKWIFNPMIETQEEFQRRRKLNLTAPWEDEVVKKTIEEKNSDKSNIVFAPSQLHKLIDQTGDKLGIINEYHFGWRAL